MLLAGKPITFFDGSFSDGFKQVRICPGANASFGNAKV
jgi:hypothetical protein